MLLLLLATFELLVSLASMLVPTGALLVLLLLPTFGMLVSLASTLAPTGALIVSLLPTFEMLVSLASTLSPTGALIVSLASRLVPTCKLLESLLQVREFQWLALTCELLLLLLARLDAGAHWRAARSAAAHISLLAWLLLLWFLLHRLLFLLQRVLFLQRWNRLHGLLIGRLHHVVR